MRVRVAAAVLLGLLAGCRGEEPATLVVWSATDTDAMAALVEMFESSHPGIRIDYREFNTSELHTAVVSGAGVEDDAGDHSGPDVVISSAMDLQVDLVNRGFAKAVEVETAVPDWAVWRGELYGFTAEPVALAYNRAAFANRALPRTRSELAGMIRDDPAFFDGRIGTYDIALSGVGYLFATQDAARGDQSSRLVESLGRAGARLFCCTSEITDRIASGELVLGYNVIGSYALAAARADPRIGLRILQDYTLVFARTAFVASDSRNPEAAGRFVRWLVSPEGQATVEMRSKLLPLTGAGDAPTGSSTMPIRSGPGLLAFLDQMKKERFLREWSLSMDGEGATAGGTADR